MALFSPSASPGITVKEIDLTGVVPSVTTTTGAFVGDFQWGPVGTPVLVDNESTLVSSFGSPQATNAVDFLSAAAFLKYSQSLYVVREVTDAAKNGHDSDAGSIPTVKNAADFSLQQSALDSDGHTFIAKYPGTAGNSLRVELCPYQSGDTIFGSWGYEAEFDAAPGTSAYASSAGGSFDEIHVVVVDEDGELTGTPGAVLERYPFVSLATDAKTTDGSSNYWKDVINNRSEYVWAVNANGVNDAAQSQFQEGQTASNTNFSLVTPIIKSFIMTDGVNSGTLTSTQYLNGFDNFESTEDIQVDFLIAPGMADSAAQATIVNDLIGTAASLRKDCVVVTSPHRGAVVGNAASSIVSDTISVANNFNASSYLIMDNNYFKVYDKYNDQYIFIPSASSTAGVMAATDAVSAPWFSPAGNRRGQYFGVTSLAYSPNKAQRDLLYKAGVNPIVNLPGQGVILFGDKTKESRPSAFDRINVRRLFLAVERSISAAARNVMFEFNDEFTRAEFVNIVEPFLREIKGRRGITDFRVVCDETNNTPAVIDRNEFVASVFIKPARSINYVTLNFVAVRTGVDFAEVVGTV